MKKTLFATSAIVAAGMATSAAAAEWETGVSGYYFLGLEVSDNNAQDGVGVLRDGEVHINGRLTADNGLTFRARVEIEAFTTGDQIDENWGSVGGSFGTVMIGGNDDAVYNNHVGVIYAPGARIGYYDTFQSLIVSQGGADAAADSFGYSRAGSGVDNLAIHYTSPNFMGFQIAANYAPNAADPQTFGNGGSDGGRDSNNPIFETTGQGTQYAVSASYNGSFDDFGIGLSGGYTLVEDSQGANIDVELFTFGANISFQGFTIAGTYEDQDVDAGGVGDGDEWALGAQYTTGPWTIAGGYSDSDQTDLELAAGWVTYAAAPGVLFTVGVEHANSKDAGEGKDFGGMGFMTLRF
jgi:predicted porin